MCHHSPGTPSLEQSEKKKKDVIQIVSWRGFLQSLVTISVVKIIDIAIHRFGLAVFEIWTLWFLERVLGDPPENF